MLDRLVAEELLETRSSSRYPGETEYAFRHALLRDAAYAMLPLAERPGAHFLAAQWFEETGETDAGLLAEHWERANAPEKATSYLATAAEAALARGDLRATERLVQRAHALGPEGRQRVRLLLSEGLLHGFAGHFERSKPLTREVLEATPRGSREWLTALTGLIYSCATTADILGFQEAMMRLGDVHEPLDASPQAALSVFMVASACYQVAGSEVAEPYAHALEAMDRQTGESDPVIHGRYLTMRASRAWHRGDSPNALRFHDEARHSFELAGEPLGLSSLTGATAALEAHQGELASAMVERVARGGLLSMRPAAPSLRAWIALEEQRPEEALSMMQNALRSLAPLRCHWLAQNLFDRVSLELQAHDMPGAIDVDRDAIVARLEATAAQLAPERREAFWRDGFQVREILDRLDLGREPQ